MWVRCADCQTKYRDVSAVGAPTIHKCKLVELLTVDRAGARLEIDLADGREDDKVISRRFAYVAQTRSDYIVTPATDRPQGRAAVEQTTRIAPGEKRAPLRRKKGARKK